MKKSGFTLVELAASLGILLLAFAGFQALFITGLRSTMRTNAATVVNQANALGVRRVVSTMNEAMSATISESGRRIDYVLPKKSTTLDANTGEYELIIPVVTDGVSRYFRVVDGGRLVDQSGRTIVRDIVSTDLDPNSSQYNQTYAPFQFTTFGGTKAITINLVTSRNVGTSKRYAKMKSTVLLRNAQ